MALQRPLELVTRQVLPDGGLGAGSISQFPPDHLWGGVNDEWKAHPSLPAGLTHLLPDQSAKSPVSLVPWSQEGKLRAEMLRPSLCLPSRACLSSSRLTAKCKLSLQETAWRCSSGHPTPPKPRDQILGNSFPLAPSSKDPNR
jgi:hypothetical protein